MTSDYRGLHCLVTGGLGFIGSNLVHRLVREGAEVTVVDSSVPGCGANEFNVRSVATAVHVLGCDIGEPGTFARHMRAPDVVFNVAGEISHSNSMSQPHRDLLLNTIAQLQFLLFCREMYPGIRVVYASTRQLYGRPQYLPVDEEHPIAPIDFNGVHKGAAEQYHLLLSRLGELDCVVLRLSNVYGPRMALHLAQQGVMNVYLATVLEGKPIRIYGDGMQLRDPLFVEDAVDAFLRAGLAPSDESRVYNISGPESLTMAQIAHIVTRCGCAPPPHHSAFPSAARSIDIGSYVSVCDRAERRLDWRPTTTFEDGVARTIEYYKDCLEAYLIAPGALLLK